MYAYVHINVNRHISIYIYTMISIIGRFRSVFTFIHIYTRVYILSAAGPVHQLLSRSQMRASQVPMHLPPPAPANRLCHEGSPACMGWLRLLGGATTRLPLPHLRYTNSVQFPHRPGEAPISQQAPSLRVPPRAPGELKVHKLRGKRVGRKRQQGRMCFGILL